MLTLLVRKEFPYLGQWYDNALLGQSYRTPHGAVIGECGTVEKRLLAGGTEELGKKPTKAQIFHSQFHLKSPEIEPGSLCCEAST
jgi:hypothetical protein